MKCSRTWYLVLTMMTGCQGQKDVGLEPKPGAAKDAAVHSHERGKMLIADCGPYHALLTAHLSQKDGNELDIFFETQDAKSPRPVALTLESFTAQVTVDGGEPKELRFDPAPATERPAGEKSGTCSHFVAKAPWMKSTDSLYVVAKLAIDGNPQTVRWADFNPKKFAHHED